MRRPGRARRKKGRDRRGGDIHHLGRWRRRRGQWEGRGKRSKSGGRCWGRQRRSRRLRHARCRLLQSSASRCTEPGGSLWRHGRRAQWRLYRGGYAPSAPCIGDPGHRRRRRFDVGQRHIGQHRRWRRRQQMRRRIKHLFALAAAHPSFRYAQLVCHHLERSGTGRAASNLAHQRWIVGAWALPPVAAKACSVSGWPSSESSRPRHLTPAVEAKVRRLPSAHRPGAPKCPPEPDVHLQPHKRTAAVPIP